MDKPRKPRLDANAEPPTLIPAAEIELGFREMVKSLRCPACECEFSDAAVDWNDAWLEGRIDCIRDYELGGERDGLAKLKCELCGKRSWLDYFVPSVWLVGDFPPLPAEVKGEVIALLGRGKLTTALELLRRQRGWTYSECQRWISEQAIERDKSQ